MFSAACRKRISKNMAYGGTEGSTIARDGARTVHSCEYQIGQDMRRVTRRAVANLVIPATCCRRERRSGHEREFHPERKEDWLTRSRAAHLYRVIRRALSVTAPGP